MTSEYPPSAPLAEIEPAPIALFVYNRPLHTARTLEALRANELAAHSDLFIFSDGPRSSDAQQGVEQVRTLLAAGVEGFKSVHIVERASNLGLAASIIDGVTGLCAQRGRVIVLEDDLVTSPYFLRFMNDGLACYEFDENVASVHGYVYPVKRPLSPTFFIRGADCWGWATWQRAWRHFEPDGVRLLAQLRGARLTREFDFGNTNAYTEMLEDQIAGRVNSWAIRWYASAFLRNMLTLYPGRSLVQNIGMDSSGTHGGDTTVYGTELATAPISVHRIALREDVANRNAFAGYFRSTQRPLVRRVLSKLRKMLRLR